MTPSVNRTLKRPPECFKSKGWERSYQNRLPGAPLNGPATCDVIQPP
jgi:hypothetical protein